MANSILCEKKKSRGQVGPNFVLSVQQNKNSTVCPAGPKTRDTTGVDTLVLSY